MRQQPLEYKGVTYLLVFLFIWSYYTGFTYAFGGSIASIAGGKLGLIITFFAIAYSFVYGVNHKGAISKNSIRPCLLITTLYLGIYVAQLVINGYLLNARWLVLYVQLFLFLLFNDNIKRDAFKLSIRIIAVIMLLSIIEYLVYLITGKGLLLATYYREGSTRDYLIEQYLFNFIVSEDSIFPRFQSLTEEPGVVGTLGAFFLFCTAKKEEYRFEYIVFLIGGLLSLSLAFYLMLIIHLICIRANLKTNISILFFVAGFYFAFQENVNNMIVQRVVERGIDERSNDYFDSKFEASIQNKTIWLGHGDSDFVSGKMGNVVGAKVWIYEYGIIGVLLVFIVYMVLFICFCKGRNVDKTLMIGFILTYWISFFQREYINQLDYFVSFIIFPLLYAKQRTSQMLYKKAVL